MRDIALDYRIECMATRIFAIANIVMNMNENKKTVSR